ncbi:5'-deoxyadenosine deaminase [Carboxydothermus ferrireducens]|uniref:5-methylthioadenosine/S-adenosylhomocysteine deaminase n=1 Tax=Carboxydothermus ferrireducens DSM 11255 TaxID=1119529 RepID=A0ABX2R5X3_9THEO|nr:5'-deoxyadenosine deaminase [Carboxydothermus ferrireducens]NYE56566.1 5-methylthioadenosine/S-adenosylhomocysteine deaminase [Carboxydothermus ferrireducens DSM 11255]
MSILIKNGTIVTMNEKREILKGDLYIEGNIIKDIGPSLDVQTDKVIDAAGKVVIPGLIQTHIHLCQTLFRGQADDLELLDWLKLRIWPLEGGHDPESLYYSAMLGIGELFKGGTTAIVDMATVNHTDSNFQAIYDSGIRAISGKCMMDYGTEVPKSMQDTTENAIDESVQLLEKWHGKDNGRILYAFTPRFAVSCTEDLLKEVVKLAEQYKVRVHTHASENKGEVELVLKERGMRNVLYLEKLGMTAPNLILAHCIHLDEREMKVLAESKTKIAHCPSSNLKLASGIAKIPELLEMGAEISIAADGAPCNNNLDAFIEMRMAALIQKPFYGPTSMPAQKVFELATIGGARAMGLEDQIGSLEVGKKADVVIVDLDEMRTTPNEGVNIYTQLVYQAQSSNVLTTIVDGKIVMENRVLKTIDEVEVRRKANESLKRIADRVGVSLE